MAEARWTPAAQALGWRLQNWNMSPSVADAAVTASVASTPAAAGVDAFGPKDGSSASTTASQKAVRSRNIMVLSFALPPTLNPRSRCSGAG